MSLSLFKHAVLNFVEYFSFISEYVKVYDNARSSTSVAASARNITKRSSAKC